ncbi:acyltransferase [Microbacterium marmarense]|uniref:acyltransferase n=1 Tax=Microbacterium marmarense TaxID=3122051 RepID=UPI003B28ADC4
MPSAAATNRRSARFLVSPSQRLDRRMKFASISGPRARLASCQGIVRAGLMFTRGVFTSPWFRHSSGPVFRGKSVTILNAQFVSHVGRLVLEDYVELQGASQLGISFGENVSIGRGTMIRPSSYYGGEAGVGLRMGDRSSVGAGGFIGCSGWIEIGNDVMIGPGVRLFSENHAFDRLDIPIKEQGVNRGQLIIEDDCWIGSGVTVMSGVRIRRGTVVAAGSVVTRDTAEGSVIAGTPARLLRVRGEDSVA